MVEVTKFKAIDGKLFTKKEDCIRHEEMIEEVNAVMATLNPIPKDTDFLNGEGYVQQDINTVARAMFVIVEIAGIEKRPEFLADPFSCRNGVIGRILSDRSNEHLWRAWQRFMNMDSKGREWGQAYFARG